MILPVSRRKCFSLSPSFMAGPGKGKIRQLPTFPGDPDGAATAVNDEGQAVGISGTCFVAVGSFSAAHALPWQNGTVTNLGSLGGIAWNTPGAINNRGVVVGFSDLPGDENGNPNFHAFRWTRERYGRPQNPSRGRAQRSHRRERSRPDRWSIVRSGIRQSSCLSLAKWRDDGSQHADSGWIVAVSP